jgi:hypothetical protein
MQPRVAMRVYDVAPFKIQIKLLQKDADAPCWGGIHVFLFCISGVNIRSPIAIL